MSSSEPARKPGDGEIKAPRLEYWLKVIPLVTSAVSGVLVLVPQTTSLFGPFDYGAEALLIVCVIGIIVFAAGLVRSKTEGRASPNSNRIFGVVLIVAAPLFAGLLWYTTLRLPPEKEEMVQREIALGDTELKVLNDPEKAHNHYRNALLLAPRKGSIRAKMQDAKDRIRVKGD
jgi:hypothetical protein